MEPELNGMEITPGDHIGNAAPDCCEQEMDRGVNKRGYRTWTCGDCSTVVEVDKNGLIFDIQ